MITLTRYTLRIAFEIGEAPEFWTATAKALVFDAGVAVTTYVPLSPAGALLAGDRKSHDGGMYPGQGMSPRTLLISNNHRFLFDSTYGSIGAKWLMEAWRAFIKKQMGTLPRLSG